jgi:hypothetical protein
VSASHLAEKPALLSEDRSEAKGWYDEDVLEVVLNRTLLEGDDENSLASALAHAIGHAVQARDGLYDDGPDGQPLNAAARRTQVENHADLVGAELMGLAGLQGGGRTPGCALVSDSFARKPRPQGSGGTLTAGQGGGVDGRTRTRVSGLRLGLGSMNQGSLDAFYTGSRQTGTLSDPNIVTTPNTVSGQTRGVVSTTGQGQRLNLGISDLNPGVQMESLAVSPAYSESYTEIMTRRGDDLAQRGVEHLQMAENSGFFGGLYHKVAAAGCATGEGLTKLLKGDRETVENAAIGAGTGVAIVATGGLLVPGTLTAVGVTGVTTTGGAAVVGWGTRALQIGGTILTPLGTHGAVTTAGTVTSSLATSQGMTLGQSGSALLDVAPLPIKPVASFLRNSYTSARTFLASRSVLSGSDEARLMVDQVELANTGLASGKKDAFTEAYQQAKRSEEELGFGMNGERNVITSGSRQGVSQDIQANIESLGSQGNKRICASYALTACVLANSGDEALDAQETLARVNATAGKVKVEAHRGKLLNEMAVLESQGDNVDPNALAALQKRFADFHTAGSNPDNIGMNLNVMDKAASELGFQARRVGNGAGQTAYLKALQTGDLTELRASSALVKADVDDALSRGHAVVVDISTGGGLQTRHAVTVLATGVNARGQKIYQIYDSQRGMTQTWIADDFLPINGRVYTPT